jgi:hypothetical protein
MIRCPVFAVLAHGGGYGAWFLIVTAMSLPPLAIFTVLRLARRAETVAQRRSMNATVMIIGFVCVAAGRVLRNNQSLTFLLPHMALTLTVLLAGASRGHSDDPASTRVVLRSRAPMVLLSSIVPWLSTIFLP